MTGCGRSYDLFLKVPTEVTKKFNLTRGMKAIPSVKEESDCNYLIYKFDKEEVTNGKANSE